MSSTEEIKKSHKEDLVQCNGVYTGNTKELFEIVFFIDPAKAKDAHFSVSLLELVIFL